jgi:nickel-dependent lactate racemase
MKKLGHRIVELKVRVSNEITDEQLEYIKSITEGIPVNVGYP